MNNVANINDVAKSNYLEIMKAFLMQLVLFLVGTFVGIFFIPNSVKSILNICFFVLIIFSMFSRKTNLFRTKASTNIYAAFFGILSGSAYVYYFVTLGAGAFLFTVLCVIFIFAASYLTAKNSSADSIFNLSKILIPGLIVLIIGEGLMYFFFRYSAYVIGVSIIGIIVYTAYTIVTMRSLMERVSYGPLSDEEVAAYSFSLFINVLYLILDILRLLSIISDND
ncbi:MAG: US12 family protein [Romboutsia sp.]|nr:US12 family protein [Romboutsia sp.]